MKSHYYDDTNFSYPAFWEGRDYEHQSELLALKKLLDNKKFECAIDIGGGFGRISKFLSRYAQKVILLEPSAVQRWLAKGLISSPSIIIREGSAEDTTLGSQSCDLVLMVRVLHHLPDPQGSISEIHRILVPGGFFVLEFANSTHMKARLKALLSFHSIPLGPINISQDIDVPFVNHNPRAIRLLLEQQGFIIHNILSVSNFRSVLLKKLFSTHLLLNLEGILQKPLARLYFGPSIFILAQRNQTNVV